MKSNLVLLVSFALLAGLVSFVSIRGRWAAKQVTPNPSGSEVDSSWNVKIGLPIIPPDHSDIVTFQIQPSQVIPPGTQRWTASYSSGGHTARFGIDIDASDRTEVHMVPMEFGKGRLVAIDGSDNSSLMEALAFALDGKVPADPSRLRILPFDYVHFGDNMSPIPGGGYQFKPSGDWTAMKIFFDGVTEDDSATVYFSLNTVTGEGRFSMSNSDYGDPVLRHFASIL